MIHTRTSIEVRMQAEKDAEYAEQRSTMIGTGGRSERVRTYRWKDNLVVDHRLSRNFNMQSVLAGDLADLIESLLAEDRAQRIAAL